ncbi:MAG: S8 family serine peptidase, partial [Anaerolineae bacterium]
PPAAKLAPGLQAALADLPPGDMLAVIVRLQPQADLSAIAAPNRDARVTQVVKTLRAQAEASRQSLQPLLTARRAEGQISDLTPFWIFNGFAVTAAPELILELAARPDVARISLNRTFAPPSPGNVHRAAGTAILPEPNVALINAPALWKMGIKGQGVVVAILDTGVDGTHPDLSGNWRGGSNSWFDPYGEFASPADVAGASSGHGTRVMGVLAGGSAGGTAIGVAPQAQWIAAKIFDQKANWQESAVHLAFQWLLDPDGNPNTPDAPQVVNNSWQFATPECSPNTLVYEPDMQALRAAGILPIFAAGNNGPAPGVNASPANNPSAFAVGAIDNASAIYRLSSRGPSACGGALFPEVAAPGVDIRTADRFGQYAVVDGTSVAAPHAAGVLALLLSAFPNLAVEDQAALLMASAADLGDSGPDNTFGYGRLDALAAYQSLADLSVSMLASTRVLTTGTPLTFTVVVTNNGPSVTNGVTLTGVLPPGTLVGPASAGQGGCLPGGSAITCTLGAMPDGTFGSLGTFGAAVTATVTIVVTPTVAGTITPSVTINSDKIDPDQFNNTAWLTATVKQGRFWVYLPLVKKL